MSGDMEDCELRNDGGYPWTVGPITRPAATFTAPHTGHLDQSTDNSVGKRINETLPWIAALLAGFAAGGVLVICLLRPWQSDDRAAQAELRAEFAQRFAAVEKNAGDAASISEIWRNRVNKLEAEANANRRR